MQFKTFVLLALPVISALAAPLPASNEITARAPKRASKPVTKPAPKPAPAPKPVPVPAPKPAPVPVPAPAPAPVDKPKPAPSAPAAEKLKPILSAPIKPAPTAPAAKPAPTAPADKPKLSAAPSAIPTAPANRAQPPAAPAVTPTAPADRNEPPAPYDVPVSNRRKLAGQFVDALILSGVVDVAATKVSEGLILAFDKVKDAPDFDAARKAFTQDAVRELFDANPDPAVYQAAVCYSSEFTVADPAAVAGKTSLELKSTTGALRTTYECFYMGAPNTFTALGDGGFVNLAIQSSDRCKFEGKVLTCA
ncbi:hypothetical protein GGTG_08707 [Gaeumannomyces tritici R3-111a-1]|uniref:DUF7888 domain-containing protein n=1 Tax=Gaeumannomyces tritici (strain R3-111a-1) TaxID=644352 RepID=J3P5B8_GAET3|nr:hypothetical protein GGTG_08707 [Gaeumannomyces tritici R3-111a-1]EJT74869.1 hypothetical protein GGTG_08707 [Gaeumannomyces tritici R3-111a-1]